MGAASVACEGACEARRPLLLLLSTPPPPPPPPSPLRHPNYILITRQCSAKDPLDAYEPSGRVTVTRLRSVSIARRLNATAGQSCMQSHVHRMYPIPDGGATRSTSNPLGESCSEGAGCVLRVSAVRGRSGGEQFFINSLLLLNECADAHAVYTRLLLIPAIIYCSMKRVFELETLLSGIDHEREVQK